MPWARDDNEFDGRKDVAPTMPRLDFMKGVGSDQEEYLRLCEGAFGTLDGVDREALTFVIFEPGGLEERIAGAGEFDHVEPVLVSGQVSIGLVGRMGRRDQQDSIEGEGVRRLPGHRQVRVVDGVKRATEQCDSQVFPSYRQARSSEKASV